MADVSESGRLIASSKQRAGTIKNGFTFFQKNDVLLAKITPCFENGKGCYLNRLQTQYGFGSTEFIVLRAKKDVPPAFVYQLSRFPNFRLKMQSLMTGSAGQQRVSLKDVFDYEWVSIPTSKDEQQHIADILTNCDEVIEQTEKAIAKYRDIKSGMLQDLFTRGLDANGKLRPKPEDVPELYKDSPLGIIPKQWKIVTVEDLFDLEVGGDLQVDCFSPHKSAIHQYPIFSNSLENAGLYGYTSAAFYPSNSITITGRGTLGHAEYRKEPFDAIIRLIVLKVKKHSVVNCNFVVEQLNFDQDFFVESTGVPQLTAPQAAKMRFRYPELPEEQNMIAKHLSLIDAQIEEEERALGKYRSLKLGLMKQLLTPPEGALEA